MKRVLIFLIAGSFLLTLINPISSQAAISNTSVSVFSPSENPPNWATFVSDIKFVAESSADVYRVNYQLRSWPSSAQVYLNCSSGTCPNYSEMNISYENNTATITPKISTSTSLDVYIKIRICDAKTACSGDIPAGSYNVLVTLTDPNGSAKSWEVVVNVVAPAPTPTPTPTPTPSTSACLDKINLTKDYFNSVSSNLDMWEKLWSDYAILNDQFMKPKGMSLDQTYADYWAMINDQEKAFNVYVSELLNSKNDCVSAGYGKVFDDLVTTASQIATRISGFKNTLNAKYSAYKSSISDPTPSPTPTLSPADQACRDKLSVINDQNKLSKINLSTWYSLWATYEQLASFMKAKGLSLDATYKYYAGLVADQRNALTDRYKSLMDIKGECSLTKIYSEWGAAADYNVEVLNYSIETEKFISLQYSVYLAKYPPAPSPTPAPTPTPTLSPADLACRDKLTVYNQQSNNIITDVTSWFNLWSSFDQLAIAMKKQNMSLDEIYSYYQAMMTKYQSVARANMQSIVEIKGECGMTSIYSEWTAAYSLSDLSNGYVLKAQNFIPSQYATFKAQYSTPPPSTPTLSPADLSCIEKIQNVSSGFKLVLINVTAIRDLWSDLGQLLAFMKAKGLTLDEAYSYHQKTLSEQYSVSKNLYGQLLELKSECRGTSVSASTISSYDGAIGWAEKVIDVLLETTDFVNYQYGEFKKTLTPKVTLLPGLRIKVSDLRSEIGGCSFQSTPFDPSFTYFFKRGGEFVKVTSSGRIYLSGQSAGSSQDDYPSTSKEGYEVVNNIDQIFTCKALTESPSPSTVTTPTPVPTPTATPSPSPTVMTIPIASPTPSISSNMTSTVSPTPRVTASPKFTPSPMPTPKVITITCVKGKLIKKVIGTNPKCPTGYVKK